MARSVMYSNTPKKLLNRSSHNASSSSMAHLRVAAAEQRADDAVHAAAARTFHEATHLRHVRGFREFVAQRLHQRVLRFVVARAGAEGARRVLAQRTDGEQAAD